MLFRSCATSLATKKIRSQSRRSAPYGTHPLAEHEGSGTLMMLVNLWCDRKNTDVPRRTQKATRLNLRPARTLTIGRGQLSIRVQASKTNWNTGCKVRASLHACAYVSEQELVVLREDEREVGRLVAVGHGAWRPMSSRLLSGTRPKNCNPGCQLRDHTDVLH